MLIQVNASSASVNAAGRNAVVTSLMICCGFIVCWTPSAIMNFMLIVGYITDVSGVFYDFATTTAFINSCVNPFIYAAKYRKSVRSRQSQVPWVSEGHQTHASQTRRAFGSACSDANFQRRWSYNEHWSAVLVAGLMEWLSQYAVRACTTIPDRAVSYWNHARIARTTPSFALWLETKVAKLTVGCHCIFMRNSRMHRAS